MFLCTGSGRIAASSLSFAFALVLPCHRASAQSLAKINFRVSNQHVALPDKSAFQAVAASKGGLIEVCLVDESDNPVLSGDWKASVDGGDLKQDSCFKVPNSDLGITKVILSNKGKAYEVVVPTAGVNESPPQLLWVDGMRGHHVEPINMNEGQTLRVWAFNLAKGQHLSVSTTPVEDATGDIAPIVGNVITAATGSPISVSPTTQSGAQAQTEKVNAGCSASCTGSVFCGSICASQPGKSNDKAASSTDQVYRTAGELLAVKANSYYAANVIDSSVFNVEDAGDPNVDRNTQIVAQEVVTAHEAHRKFSVGLEEAWSMPGPYPTSGYSYVPVGQSGPDQLYQLQEVSRASDTMTLSALALFYPVAAFSSNYHCTSRFALGFGPTLVRGTTAEVFRQWNARAGMEVFTDTLVSFGFSERNLDIPNGDVGATKNSIISVARPAAPPAFATVSRWETLLSFGITIDLDVITRGVASVANAASGSAKGGSK